MKAISIKQPWAIAIFRGKDVENRSRPSNYRGPLLIHASLKIDMAGYDFIKKNFPSVLRCENHERGCIIGKVDMVDCMADHPSKWFAGPFGYVFKNPVLFKTPIPYKGQLGIFNVPDEILKER